MVALSCRVFMTVAAAAVLSSTANRILTSLDLEDDDAENEVVSFMQTSISVNKAQRPSASVGLAYENGDACAASGPLGCGGDDDGDLHEDDVVLYQTRVTVHSRDEDDEEEEDDLVSL
eukprot:TRINITY_DN27920_c0_g1_i1.p2 TRINITY_DN27920_c0_g1~~TRINITY_DN27920_c0_g1_i1.p2  ORF type:complete len:132 (+),score=36.87 TRINITY_DN27920_c0_g1_i1:44-397(+)